MNEEIKICPACDSTEVNSWRGEDTLQYGLVGRDQVTLVVKDIVFHECETCGQIYTDEDGMQKRQAAVDEYLASKAK